MERKVNEVFKDFNGNKVKAVVENVPVEQLGTCDNCCYSNCDCWKHRDIIGVCTYIERSDNQYVIFKEENDNEE